MDFSFSIQLKQHTPLIHFQHDQAGATLRATEVKAKLDKFIWEHFDMLTEGEEEFKQYKQLFDPESKANAPFKIRIRADFEAQKILIASSLTPEEETALRKAKILFIKGTPYFAVENELKNIFEPTGETVIRNNKEREVLEVIKNHAEVVTKWGILAKSDDAICIDFFSFIPQILSILKKSIHLFFVYQNFGTRQSKGFGQFFVIDPIPDATIDQMLKKLFPISYAITDNFNGDQLSKIQRQFERITSDYKLLKAGKSQRDGGTYRKSLLFLYALNGNNPIRWEKRAIKININKNLMKDSKNNSIGLLTQNTNSAIYDKDGNQSWHDPQDSGFKYAYIRAILGLAEQFEFQTDKGFNTKYVVSVKSNNDVERFRSPIQFKIHEEKIYLVATEVSTDDILNRE